MFELIEEASSIPLNFKKSYYRQNKILKEMRFLHTAFEGIKLDISYQYNPPIIRRGSICMFCYSLFEAKENIYLIDISTDNWKEAEDKYIALRLANNGKKLIVDITKHFIASYNEELGGYYYIQPSNNNAVLKYIPCIINFDGSIYRTSWFDNYNNEVY